MRRSYRRLVDAWFSAQVELHGQYSLARLNSLHAYTEKTPMWRVLLVCAITPILSIVLITLTDCMRLQAPARGLGESYTLWIRSYISICAISGGAITQLRILIPKLAMSVIEVVLLTLISSAAAVATQFAFAIAIGYPVPFGLVLGTPTCLVVIVAGVTLPRIKVLRAKPRLRRQLGNYVNVLMCQIGMTVIYPVYNYAFSRLKSVAQTAFVLLLPAIKLLNKNWLRYSLREADDMRPELVTFNVEVFHALYVSMCMQSSTSISTTVAIMAIDALQAWISIHDINHIVREMTVLLAKVPNAGYRVSAEDLLKENRDGLPRKPLEISSSSRQRTLVEAAIAVLMEDASVRHHDSMRQDCFLSSDTRRNSALALSQGPSVAAIAHASSLVKADKNHSGSMKKSTAVSPTDPPFTPTIFPVRENEHEVVSALAPHSSMHPFRSTKRIAPTNRPTLVRQAAGLNGDERLRLVQKTLQMLFVTEFVVLVEYTEVMIPIIYNACTIGMIRLPNRAFYKQLASKTDEELKQTFGNVALYGTLEFISFAVFCVLLRYKLRFSVLTQVAFVLENQFVMVQAKLMMWVFYVIQTSLQHFGADFSFSFEWLKAAH